MMMCNASVCNGTLRSGLFSASGASRGWCPPWCTHEKRRWSEWRRTRSCSTPKRWCRVWRRCEGNTLSSSTLSWTALSRPSCRRNPACSARAWRTSSWGWERRRYLNHWAQKAWNIQNSLTWLHSFEFIIDQAFTDFAFWWKNPSQFGNF